MARSESKYSLTIPLDASGVEDRDGGQELKVVARDGAGALSATTVKIGRGGTGKASLEFAERPQALRIAVGPAEATDEEILGLQTLATEVTERAWAGKAALEISPIVISAYYWWWWRRWCRQFTIRGRVVCPDGSPVPGADVCAYDVDWWFLWSSQQLVGCTQTAFDGTFELKFRWCCGWWPWWWWRLRSWQLDESLVERVGKALRVTPELELGRITSQPSLRVFDRILEDPAARRPATLGPGGIAELPRLRERLVSRLPKAPELEALRVWPWYPWFPWWDCTPDIIFKVTQDCGNGNQVILQETIADTRWNIPNPLDVGLVVSDEACCVPRCPEPPCGSLECIILDQVCGVPFTDVGGNPGAAATPEGYAHPGPVPANSTSYHRVFAGTIPIWKNPDDLVGFDYYELEYDRGLGWEPLPADAAVDFNRVYWEFPPGASQTAPFVFTTISGHEVVETRVHYENNHAPTWPNEPGPTNAWWLSPNYSLLALLDTTKIGDGTFRFRVIGWQEGPGPSLQNPVPIPVCGSLQDNEFVLTFNNRVITSPAAHPASHNCGQGVHLCTEQPDTHILAVRVDGVPVDACDTVDLSATSTLEVDFLAEDSDGLLAFYDLYASWGLNQSHNLLLQPGAEITALGAPQTGYPAAPLQQASGNYGTAVSQGAAPPLWAGGTFRLTMPMSSAFPDPCCYQLELRAFRRMIVGSGSSCEHGYVVGVNGNRTEYSIGVGVCPPRSDVPAVVETIDRDRR